MPIRTASWELGSVGKGYAYELQTQAHQTEIKSAPSCHGRSKDSVEHVDANTDKNSAGIFRVDLSQENSSVNPSAVDSKLELSPVSAPVTSRHVSNQSQALLRQPSSFGIRNPAAVVDQCPERCFGPRSQEPFRRLGSKPRPELVAQHSDPRPTTGPQFMRNQVEYSPYTIQRSCSTKDRRRGTEPDDAPASCNLNQAPVVDLTAGDQRDANLSTDVLWIPSREESNAVGAPCNSIGQKNKGDDSQEVQVGLISKIPGHYQNQSSSTLNSSGAHGSVSVRRKVSSVVSDLSVLGADLESLPSQQKELGLSAPVLELVEGSTDDEATHTVQTNFHDDRSGVGAVRGDPHAPSAQTSSSSTAVSRTCHSSRPMKQPNDVTMPGEFNAPNSDHEVINFDEGDGLQLNTVPIVAQQNDLELALALQSEEVARSEVFMPSSAMNGQCWLYVVELGTSHVRCRGCSHSIRRHQPRLIFQRIGHRSLSHVHLDCVLLINGLVRPSGSNLSSPGRAFISTQVSADDEVTISAQLAELPTEPVGVQAFHWPPNQRPHTQRVRGDLRRLLQSDRDYTAEDYEMLLELDGNGTQLTANEAPQREALIQQLPVSKASGAQNGIQCSICLEDTRSGQEVRTLPCMHLFHRKCIDKWLATSRRPLCPIDQVEIDLQIGQAESFMTL